MTDSKFNDAQFESLYPEGVANYYWSRGRNMVIKDFLKKNNLLSKRILEIGCGRGIVLRVLRDTNIDCYGVELSTLEVPGDLKNIMWTGVSFKDIPQELINSIEVVALFDVLEHVEDDKRFISDIKQTFPKLESLVVTVPARQELFSAFDTYNGHFRRYNITQLNNVASEAGLNTDNSSYFFHSLYVPARLSSFFRGTRSTAVSPPIGKLTVFIHSFVAKIFFWEYKLLPRKLPGTSIISLLKVES